MFFTNDLGMFSVYQEMSVMRFKLWKNYQGHVIKEWQSSEPNPTSLIQGQCSSTVKLPPQPSASLVAQGLGSLAFFLPLQPFLLFSPNGYSSSTFNSRPPQPLWFFISLLSPSVLFPCSSWEFASILSHVSVISSMWWTLHSLSSPTLTIEKNSWTLESERLEIKYQHSHVPPVRPH